MQFVLYLIIVFLLSLPVLTIKESAFFSVGILLYNTIGQMLIGLIFGFIWRPLSGKIFGNPEKYINTDFEKYTKIKTANENRNVIILRTLTYILLIIIVLLIHLYLVIPVVVSIAMQLFFEKIGERQYHKYLNNK